MIKKSKFNTNYVFPWWIAKHAQGVEPAGDMGMVLGDIGLSNLHHDQYAELNLNGVYAIRGSKHFVEKAPQGNS